jgi:anhydro-N-acetylmuramic acid kinase
LTHFDLRMEKFKQSNGPFIILGLMSGTSLDGLDICACEFLWNHSTQHWQYQIIKAETIPYNTDWQNKLRNATLTSASAFVQLHHAYGVYLGQQALAFIQKHQIAIDAIASHGHTIFHEPAKQIHFQIGNGAYIAAQTNIVVVSDFRTQDIALGGQGAPLVPIGDSLLFASYDACLNLGGFANVSFNANGKRVAFDIVPCNIVLNQLAQHFGMAYDEDGELAKSGKFIPELFDQLNQLEYYKAPYPKSLGYEWVVKNIETLLFNNTYSKVDLINTFCYHIAYQIKQHIPTGHTTLTTGGGALNKFLVEQIKKQLPSIIIPHTNTIHFKEALIFAFLGLLKLRGEVNVLKSVTGSVNNHSSGVVYSPY